MKEILLKTAAAAEAALKAVETWDTTRLQAKKQYHVGGKKDMTVEEQTIFDQMLQHEVRLTSAMVSCIRALGFVVARPLDKEVSE